MAVYRIHIRPKGGLANPKVSFKYCLEKKVLGLGWPVETDNISITWAEFLELAKDRYSQKSLTRVKYLKNNLKENDLIWTRDTNGEYYLAKSNSSWEYFSSSDALDADILNVVRCNILKVPSIDDVPGKVIACFRPTRAIQSIKDKTTTNYSKYLWNKLSETEAYTDIDHEFTNVFSFLDADETEDIIFIYLQTQGWIVIPNSRKADTMSYEFFLINRETKAKAIVQVKTGHTSLDPEEKKWTDRTEEVFLFQSNGKYENKSSGKIQCISPTLIEDFMRNNKSLLPASILHWLELYDAEKYNKALQQTSR